MNTTRERADQPSPLANLPKDVLILLELPAKDLISFFTTSTDNKKFINDEVFWGEKVARDFGQYIPDTLKVKNFQTYKNLHIGLSSTVIDHSKKLDEYLERLDENNTVQAEKDACLAIILKNLPDNKSFIQKVIAKGADQTAAEKLLKEIAKNLLEEIPGNTFYKSHHKSCPVPFTEYFQTILRMEVITSSPDLDSQQNWPYSHSFMKRNLLECAIFNLKLYSAAKRLLAIGADYRSFIQKYNFDPDKKYNGCDINADFARIFIEKIIADSKEKIVHADNIRDAGNRNLLAIAIKYRLYDTVEDLLNLDVSPLHRDEDGNSALMLAIKDGNTDLANQIIKKCRNKENTIVSDYSDLTVYEFACIEGNTEVINLVKPKTFWEKHPKLVFLAPSKGFPKALLAGILLTLQIAAIAAAGTVVSFGVAPLAIAIAAGVAAIVTAAMLAARALVVRDTVDKFTPLKHFMPRTTGGRLYTAVALALVFSALTYLSTIFPPIALVSLPALLVLSAAAVILPFFIGSFGRLVEKEIFKYDVSKEIVSEAKYSNNPQPGSMHSTLTAALDSMRNVPSKISYFDTQEDCQARVIKNSDNKYQVVHYVSKKGL